MSTRPCASCGAKTHHTVFRNGLSHRICCGCHVAQGGAPAFSHPECLAAARQRREKPPTRLLRLLRRIRWSR